MSAFTRLELAVVVAVLAVLSILGLLALRASTVPAAKPACVYHLKNVGLALRIFATDNNDRFPWDAPPTVAPPLAPPPAPAQNMDEFFKNYLAVTNEIADPKFFACPTDTRKPAADWKSFSLTNVSYFLSPNAAQTFPQSFLGGDRNVMTNGVRLKTGLVKVSTNSVFGWDSDMHKNQGNTVMGDGSVQQLSSKQFNEQATNSPTGDFTLAIP